MKHKDYLLKFRWLYLLAAVICLLVSLGIDQTVTVMMEDDPAPHYPTIVIDAGHGGIDGGAVSCSGALESGINLQIAIRLNDLCHLLGYQTHMIRTSDVSIHTEGNTIAAKKVSDLQNRVQIINGIANGIVISIHQNIFADSRYSGAQVFHASTEGSKALAEQLQSVLVTTVNPGSNRQCKPADGIYLMQHIRCTGVIVECGFLSNPQEEAMLRSAEYQKKLCCVIVSGLHAYINA